MTVFLDISGKLVIPVVAPRQTRDGRGAERRLRECWVTGEASLAVGRVLARPPFAPRQREPRGSQIDLRRGGQKTVTVVSTKTI